MPRLIPISGREMCKLLERIGFSRVHQVGSHARYIHPDGLRQAEISRKDYEKLR